MKEFIKVYENNQEDIEKFIITTLKNNNIGEKIGLLFLLEEETCSGGAKLAKNNFAPRVNYIINGEPTELKLTKAAKGVVVFDLEATGQAGHSAYPETGFSAVHILTEDIQKLLNLNWPSDSVLGETTLNFGIIEGGIARNIFAPKAKVQCLARTVVELEEMQEIIKANISEHTEYKFVSYTEPMPFHTVELPENNLETCVVAFGSDAPHLKDLGKIMLIGPGSILDAHTSHEHIKVEDLRKAVKIYENLCVKLLD